MSDVSMYPRTDAGLKRTTTLHRTTQYPAGGVAHTLDAAILLPMDLVHYARGHLLFAQGQPKFSATSLSTASMRINPASTFPLPVLRTSYIHSLK